MAKLFGEIAEWIKKDVMGAVVGQSLREFFKKEVGEAGGVIGERIRRLVRENPRAELLYVLLTLNEEEARKFWDVYDKKAVDEGFEDTFIKTIAQAIPRKKDGELDLERGKSVYTQILQMDEKRFWQLYDELKHDPIAQRVKHWLKHGRGFAEALLEAVAYSAGVITRWGGQINQHAEQTAQEIQAWRQRSEFPCVNRRTGEPHRSLWTWFVSKHKGLL